MSKGVFIEGITVDMLRNASLEAVEELMNNGDMVDLEVNQAEWTPCSERCSERLPPDQCMIDIYIRDKDSGIVRRVGDDRHDMLTINKHGQLCYYNLQNGGGCRTGEEPQDWYEFVPNQDEYGDPTDPREDGEA